MTFKSFVIYGHFCTLMLLQKGFFYQGESQEDYGSNYNSSTSKWWLCEPRWWISRLPLDLEPQYTLFVTHQQIKRCTNKWVVARFNVKKLLDKVNIWVNSGSWWWTGRPGVLRFMGSQRVGHDWATELNWNINEIRLFKIRFKERKYKWEQSFESTVRNACFRNSRYTHAY